MTEVNELKPTFEPTVHLKCRDPDDDAMQKIAELRQLISSNPLYIRYMKFCSDKQLMLFLTAKSFNMKEAKKLVEEALKWRASRDVENIENTPGWQEKFSKESETGKIYISGFDQWGRPVVVFDNAAQNTTDIGTCH
jgi:hypothetical protein